jgi:aryl-alcohol dehydrogenase-like predicted oxidoreductase
MQNHYNLAYREEEREMLPMLRDMGVGCIPWSPLARGFLTDDPEKLAPSPRRDVDPLRKQYYSGDSDRAVAAAVGEVAKARGVTRAQVVVAWLLSPNAASGGVASPIVGVQDVAELEDLVAGVGIDLTPEEVKRLEAPYRPKPVMGHI